MNEATETKLTAREAKGVKAIKYLQGIVNIPETDEQALAGWRGMSEHEQDFTLEFYGAVQS